MAYCYFQNGIVEESNANISLSNLGMHRGLGIFDLFRTRNEIPTFLEDYLDRFENSQKFLNLNRHIEKEEIREAIGQLQQKNGYRNSTFKMVLLGDGTETDETLSPLFFILNKPLADNLKSDPSTVITCEHLREFPEIKSLNYMASFRHQQRRVQAGAVDILLHKNGLISETSRSNVFIVKDGIISTAKDKILHGITRKNVLKAVSPEIEVQLRDITLDEVLNADEVFLTSTIKAVMPIVKIDDQTIGNGKEGLITRQVSEIFQSIAH